ncbi:MAG: hypothetical protein JJ896_09635 [Rhodothermales bacterium]|nr:hypothetical protein [Rhodothermales bacterium]MBO6779900.1 hypothetical protein [Rhodothermales bacterium]
MKPPAPSDKKTKAGRQPYSRPELKCEGTLEELTQAEYGGLDRAVFGTLFAIASPGLPGAPSR